MEVYFMNLTFSNKTEYFRDEENNIIFSNPIGTSMIDFIELDFSQINQIKNELFNQVNIDVEKEEISHDTVFRAERLISKTIEKHIYLENFQVPFFHGSDYLLSKKTDFKETNREIRNFVARLQGLIYDINKVQSEFKTIIEYCFLNDKSESYQKLNPYQRYYYFINYKEKRIKKKEEFDKGYADRRIKFDKKRESISRYGAYKRYEIFPMDKINIKEAAMAEAEIIDAIAGTYFELNEIVECSTLESICMNQLMEMLKNNVNINRCENCGKLFIPEGRIDTEYCNRLVIGSSKTCREIGATKKYLEKSKSNPIMREFQREYKKMNSRVRIRRMTQNQFYNWSEKARELRDRAINENMALEIFMEELRKLEG
jgi:hypothetical protein